VRGGRFGLLSSIPGPGCGFTDLIVRSAPLTAVHHWSFTTSRDLGLPDLLDTFAGHTWTGGSDGVDRAALGGAAATGAGRLAGPRSDVDTARAALAAAVAAGDAVEVAGLADAARAAVTAAGTESVAVHDLLTDALGVAWRPTPPVVELLT